MMRVLGDKVLVALPPLESEREESIGYDYRAVKTTESGVILAHRGDSYSEEASTRGIVMQLGEKPDQVDREAVLSLIGEAPFRNGPFVCPADLRAEVTALSPAPFDVAVGDCVLFAPSAGNAFEHDGINYVLLREDELLAVLEPQKVDAA